MEIVKYHIRAYREHYKTDIDSVNINGQKWTVLNGKDTCLHFKNMVFNYCIIILKREFLGNAPFRGEKTRLNFMESFHKRLWQMRHLSRNLAPG